MNSSFFHQGIIESRGVSYFLTLFGEDGLCSEVAGRLLHACRAIPLFSRLRKGRRAS